MAGPFVGPERVFILHQGALGDWILSLPAVAAVCHAYVGAAADVVLQPALLPLLSCVELPLRGIPSDDARLLGLWRTDTPRMPGLGPYSAAYVFGRRPVPVLLDNLRALGARIVRFVPTFPDGPEQTHVIAHQTRALEAMGITARIREPRLRAPEEASLWARAELAARGIHEAPVAVHAGSGSSRKNWPLDRYEALAAFLEARMGVDVVWFRGPAEEGTVHDPEGRHVFQGLPLDRVAALLEGCRGYVGNDSGITHLAAAAGVPTLALFGPTDPAVWKPVGRRVRVLRRGSSMDELPLQTVMQTAEAEFSFG